MSTRGKIAAGCALLLFVCLGIWVVRTTPDAPPPVEKVEVPKTVSYSGNVLSEERNGKKLWDLTAERSELDLESQDVDLTNIVGHFYLEDGRTIELHAKHGIYKNKTRDIQVDGEVAMTTSDGASLSSERLEWLNGEGMLIAEGKARLSKDDLLAEGDRMESANGFQHFWIRGNAHIVKGAKDANGASEANSGEAKEQ